MMNSRRGLFALLGVLAAGVAFAGAGAASLSSSGELKPLSLFGTKASSPPASAMADDARQSSAAGSTPMDYLVQMVCDDGAGGHTSADPVTCPTTARKLRIGEALPYHKYDGPPSTGSQISDSFPVGDIHGRTRTVHTFFFTTYSHTPVFDGAAARVDYGSYDAAAQTGMTGYDMGMADGTYVSFMGTYDGGRGWQPFWANSSCGQADTWIVAPKSNVVPFGQGNASTSIQIGNPQCPTVSNFGTSLTVWNNYASVGYEGGAVLDTIKTWHFSDNSVNSNAIEVFYFTQEYGKTRWEAWVNSTQAPSPSLGALAKCPNNVGTGYVTFGATTYTLQDCHDWSFIVPVSGSDWDPAVNWHVDPVFNSVNLLQNTHLQCTSGGSAADCTPGGGTGSCTTLAPWNTLGAVTIGVDEVLMGRDAPVSPPTLGTPRRTANCAITAYNAAAGTSSIYQDVVSIPPGHTNYTFGAALWRPYASNVAAAQTAYVTVFEVNAGGVVAIHQIPVSVDRKRQIAKSTFALNPATTWLRFEIYFDTPGLYYEFSDAWIAPAV